MVGLDLLSREKVKRVWTLGQIIETKYLGVLNVTDGQIPQSSGQFILANREKKAPLRIRPKEDDRPPLSSRSDIRPIAWSQSPLPLCYAKKSTFIYNSYKGWTSECAKGWNSKAT